MYKTITLGGAEQQVKVAGQNCDVRNDGAETIYASAKPNVTAGADGVLSIPIGQAAKLLDCRGTVYLLGTGSVLICGNDYSELVFKCAATSSGEGGTVDGLARTMATANTTSIAQMKPITENVSNENLLINGDFKNAINQRGQTEYNIVTADANSYSIDRWRSAAGFKITVDDGLVIEPTTEITVNGPGAVQVIDPTPFIGKTLTFSADVAATNDYAYMLMYATNVNGTFVRSTAKIHLEPGINKVTIENIPDTAKKLWAQFTVNTGANVGDVLKLNWAKLENGSVATPFTPADPATELVKCQRFYQIHTTGDIDPVDLRPNMGTITDIAEREDGNYAYIAELW